VAAFINQGLVSLKRRWQMKYGFGMKVIPNQSYAFLQYAFFGKDKQEIDMKEKTDAK
jgi:ribonuclease G